MVVPREVLDKSFFRKTSSATLFHCVVALRTDFDKSFLRSTTNRFG